MHTKIFGYGSLLNPASRKNTFDEINVIEDVVLKGYRRVLNACHESYDHIAMNLAKDESFAIAGVVLTVHDHDLPALREREIGYDLVEVTKNLSIDSVDPVYTFIVQNPVLLDHSEYKQSTWTYV